VRSVFEAVNRGWVSDLDALRFAEHFYFRWLVNGKSCTSSCMITRDTRSRCNSAVS
jgi:hypothetical protein